MIAVHDVGALGVVGGVHAAGVRIAPEALQHLVAVECGGAGRLEETVDGRDGATGGAHLVPACAGTEFHWDLLALTQQRVLVGQVSLELSPGRVDIAGRLGDTDLGEGILLGLLTGEGGPHPLALVFHVRLVGAVGHPDDGRRDGGGVHGPPRHAVDGRGVGLESACRTVIHRPVGQETVLGHEHVLDDEGVTAGRLQADDMPVVADLVVAQRHQEAAEIDRAAVLDHRTADERPRRVVAARRPQPGSVDEVPAVDHRAGAHRGVRGGDANRRIVGPDVLLGLLVELRQVPVVHTEDAAGPPGRPACAGDAAHGFEEDGGIALQPAPLLGLEEFEETRLLQIRDVGVRKPTQLFGVGGAFAQAGQNLVDRGQNRLRIALLN